MEDIVYRSIGVIHSPHSEAKGSPIQPSGARGVAGWIELEEKYLDGLADVAGFSHLIVLYHFHQSQGFKLQVTPFLDQTPRGLFATRAPKRPNAIGLSVVRLTGVRGNIIDIRDVDILDGTPLLDIKPFVPKFDLPEGEVKTGWLEKKSKEAEAKKADERFVD